jgi:hypothetical protein
VDHIVDAPSREPWDGKERRSGNGKATRLGQWMLARAPFVAAFIFISVLAHGVEAAAIVSANNRSKKQLAAVERIQQENRRGVFRIVACTTPGFVCKAESDLTVQKALIHIDHGHRVIACLLLIQPPARDEGDAQVCNARAMVETNERLRELDQQIEQARKTLPQEPKLEGK